MASRATPEPASLGAVLRAAREAAGQSVEQVCATTRLRATLVRDLEQDRLESSGGAVYARGHVRNIANALGIDPAPLVAQFDREQSAREGPEVAPRPVAPPAPRPADPSASLSERVLGIGGLGPAFSPRRERRGPNWALAGSIAVVALVAIVAVGSRGGGGTGPTTVAGLSGAGPTVSPAPAEAVTPAPRPLASAAVAALPASTDAQLRVRTIGGPSWIQVRDATATIFEGVLPDGTTKDFKDPKVLHIVVGNSGAVSLVCSGRDLGPVGGPGKISRFDCSSAGLFAA